jgi:hypothetical protein
MPAPPTRLEIDLERAKKARVESIWKNRGSSKAEEDALKALRIAIVDERQKVLDQRADALCKLMVPPNDPGTLGDKIHALKEARAALEALKK